MFRVSLADCRHYNFLVPLDAAKVTAALPPGYELASSLAVVSGGWDVHICARGVLNNLTAMKDVVLAFVTVAVNPPTNSSDELTDNFALELLTNNNDLASALGEVGFDSFVGAVQDTNTPLTHDLRVTEGANLMYEAMVSGQEPQSSPPVQIGQRLHRPESYLDYAIHFTSSGDPKSGTIRGDGYALGTLGLVEGNMAGTATLDSGDIEIVG